MTVQHRRQEHELSTHAIRIGIAPGVGVILSRSSGGELTRIYTIAGKDLRATLQNNLTEFDAALLPQSRWEEPTRA